RGREERRRGEDRLRQAEAVEHFAAAANDQELLNHAREIRIRAKRRAGELLAEMKANGKLTHAHKGNSFSPEGRTKLGEIGGSEKFSSEAQRLASASEEVFEEASPDSARLPKSGGRSGAGAREPAWAASQPGRPGWDITSAGLEPPNFQEKWRRW